MDITGHTVWVTGGAGFIGGAVRRALHAAGAAVLNWPRSQLDLTDEQATVEAISQADTPIHIVHCAGCVGGRAWLRANDAMIERETDAMTDALLAVMQRCDVQRVLVLGSTSSYAPAASVPFKESDWSDGAPADDIAGYVRSKRRSVHALTSQAHAPCAAVLPCNIYGPGQRMAPDRSNVVGALVCKFVDAARNGDTTVECWGANASREFLHVDDCATGIVDALCTLEHGEVVNIGSGVATPIRSLTQQVATAAGYDGHMQWADEDAPIDALYTSAEHARATLQWRPRIALEQGLAQCVAWHGAQQA